nr:cation-independent mannose-6-phosphate receptor-like isoform X1 [Cherax quadricarinatus]
MYLRVVFLAVYLGISGVYSVSDLCQVTDGAQLYDVSELADRDYWKVTETLHTGIDERRVFYLSLCHGLRNAPSVCAGNATGVCVVKHEGGNNTQPQVVVSNAGQLPTTGIRVAEEGWLEYAYDSGQPCPHRGGGKTYKTSVNLICPSDVHYGASGPVFMSSRGCDFLFAWMTKAACPKKLDAQDPTSCTVKFSNSDQVLNLHALHSSSFYTVKRAESTYEINICGAVTNGSCGRGDATICNVKNGSNPVVLGTTKNMNLEWEEERLILFYKQEGHSVEIELYCDRSRTTPHIYFVSSNESTTIFSLKTFAVCAPKPPECVVEDDDGNVFDLRPLYKSQGNWEVLDTRRENKNDMYHINICGEVNEGTFYHCPLGPAFACQTSVGREASYNLGFIASHPYVNKDGSITVLYTGGDMCKNGQHTRSTRINLVCNPVEHHPMLVEETETCEYVFNWLTPVACPRHVRKGSACQVVDPLYENLYDLNPLRNENKDYNITDGEHNYLVNLCGPLVTSCKGGTSGICQIKGDEEYSAGLATSNVTFNDGTLTMNFANGSGGCEGDNTRSTQIIFLCDQEENGRDGPHFLHETSCTYYFLWRTRHACPPFRVVDCSVFTSDGMVYDLNELSSPNMNEEYFNPGDSRKFVLNVCRSIVHSKSSRCPYNAAACVIDLKHENKSVNIGEVHSGPYLEDGNLKLKYTGGEFCGNSSKRYETVIEFKCDKDELYPYPQLIGEENCKYLFEWKTSVACPVSTETTTTSEINAENCTVSNSYTGYNFDLNSLKRDTGYEVQDSEGLHLVLNVCAEVSQEKCSKKGAAACSFMHNSETNIVNAGQANANLHFLPGFLFLHYTGGDECSNATKRSTLISFICGAESAKEGPVLIHDDLDRCTYFVNWYTDLACERRINCFVDTWEHRIDLSPLIKASGNYETSNPDNPKEKFYLNVCRPLNPIAGLNCQPGSSACLYSPTLETKILSLGHPDVTPTYIYNDGVQIMYTHGSTCTSNQDYSISSRIHFICDVSAGMGNPVFKNRTHDCQYQFEWRTSLVCEKSVTKPDTGPVCQIKFDAAKANIDLTPLQRKIGYSVKFGNKIYKINICGPVCQESGVCTSDGDSYGLINKSELKWDYDQLKLTYYGGTSCVGALSGHKTTSIYFECDMSAGFGYPVADDLMESLDCLAVFRWKTNITCIEAIYNNGNTDMVLDATEKPAVHNTGTTDIVPGVKERPSITDDNMDNVKNDSGTSNPQKSKVMKPFSATSAVIASVLVISGIVFVAVLILFKSERGQHVVASARRLFGIRGYTNIGQPRSENSTLLGTTSSVRVFRVDDSDDDLLRV